jgi:hypothetical protein
MLFATAVTSPVWADQTDAANAISSAKSTLVDCYSAAQEAEAAGGNITVLTDSLNKAGSLLSQAELAYATNDFDSARTLAVQSQNSLSSFIEEANALQDSATQLQFNDFLINVVASVLGTFAVIAAGFVAWVFLKRRYQASEANSK